MPTVRKSTVIEAPLEAIWGLVRDFNSHGDWHPAIAESHVEDGRGGDEVGCVRRFRLRDGGELREQLLKLSDVTHSQVYCILDSPIALYDYVATLTLKPVTDGGATFIEWSSSFETPRGSEIELAELVAEDIYQAGFDALRERFERRGAGGAVAARRAAGGPATGVANGHGIRMRGHGGPEVLEWAEVDAPPPGPGEVRIRHTAIGVNYIDVYCRTGYFDLVPPGGVPGMEAAGIVVDAGAGVEGLLPGDRVAYACPPPGAYCEVRTLPAALVVMLPEDLDDETAAAGLLKGLTADFLLRRVHRVREGDTVLVHAAAGGVGTLLCQWASHLGATVIGTVGDEEKARLARANGCAWPIRYRDDDFVERVRKITDGRGADVVYDAVGRDTFMKSYEALAVRGHLVSYGQASGPIPEVDIAAFAARSASVSRPNYVHYTSTPAEVQAGSARLFEAVRSGAIRVRVGQRFALREAAQAHRALERRATTGSTILLP